MKATGLLLVALISFAFQSHSQGTSNFEIWGLTNQTKAQFLDKYKQVTRKDLNHTYTCAADLVKMGYPDGHSQLWVDDIDRFLSGKLNWDSTERLAIIRPMPDNRFNTEEVDALNQKVLEASISELKGKDPVFIEQFLDQSKGQLYRFLVGLNSKNRYFREDCKGIILAAPKMSLRETSDNADLLASLLTIPDDKICYAAMGIITYSGWSKSANRQLFAPGAITLRDFLHSDLRTFRVDAVSFLAGRENTNGRENPQYWSSWLDSQKSR